MIYVPLHEYPFSWCILKVMFTITYLVFYNLFQVIYATWEFVLENYIIQQNPRFDFELLSDSSSKCICLNSYKPFASLTMSFFSSFLETLISKSLSTGVRQMGHRFDWNLNTLAHPLHIHYKSNKRWGCSHVQKISPKKYNETEMWRELSQIDTKNDYYHVSTRKYCCISKFW